MLRGSRASACRTASRYLPTDTEKGSPMICFCRTGTRSIHSMNRWTDHAERLIRQWNNRRTAPRGKFAEEDLVSKSDSFPFYFSTGVLLKMVSGRARTAKSTNLLASRLAFRQKRLRSLTKQSESRLSPAQLPQVLATYPSAFHPIGCILMPPAYA